MKKRLFILGVFFYTIPLLSAKIVKVNELTYEIDEKRATASVTYKNAGSNQQMKSYTLSKVIIPSSIEYGKKTYRVTSISPKAFYYCRNLTQVTIPNSINTIGDEAFKKCDKLATINIPDNVSYIGKWAFSYCDNLLSAHLPNKLIFINERLFYNCQKLETIDIPENVKSIRYSAFSDCKNLHKVDLHQGIEGIGATAFLGCSSLQSIIFPKSLTSIGEVAFKNAKLRSVSIHKNIKSIGRGAFSGCPLTTIDVDPENNYFCSENGVLYDKNITALVQYPSAKTNSSYEIPNTVKTIWRLSVYACPQLNTLIIPNSVTSIEINAVLSCSNLTSVTIPRSVTSIGGSGGNALFESCPKLKELRCEKGFKLSLLPSELHSLCRTIEASPLPPKKEVANSQSRQLDKTQTLPPLLKLVDGSLSFIDGTKNNCIDANEKCAIKFTVKNEGKGTAQNCEARVKLSGSTSGISVQTIKLPSIAAGQTYEINIPVSSNTNTQDGKVTMSIEVYEPKGWGVASFDLAIVTKSFKSPHLQVVKMNMSTPSGEVHKMEYITLSYAIQNIKYGDAESVKTKVIIPDNIAVIDGQLEMSYPLIKPGEIKWNQVVFVANNNYSDSTIPIMIDVKEKYGKYAENKKMDVELVQSSASVTNITVKEESATYKIVSAKDNAIVISGSPHISILTNTSVSIMRPDWYNKYHNPQNIKSPFPYAVIQLELKGDKEAIDLAKERLSLVMGGKHIVEAKDNKESNTIYFLVHCRNEYIDLDCGDGCEPINIWKERLEPNKVYHGNVTVSVQ